MEVVYTGRDSCLMTDYNGKRYCFHKNKPVNISPELYQAIILSGHVSASEVMPYERPIIVQVGKPEAKPSFFGKKGKGKK